MMYAVWPIKAPLVCCRFWDQAAWDTHENGFRPKDYHGGRYDAEAWAKFAAGRLQRWKVKEINKLCGRTSL